MSDSTAQLRLLLTGPVVCALVLTGVMFDNRHYRSDADCENFHRRAKVAVEAIPLAIGPWVGRAETLRPDELDLLKPNAYRKIVFTDTRPEAVGDPSRQVRLLVDQCRWANNMSGHYPPVCYRAQGDEPCDTPANAPAARTGRDRWWTVDRVKLHGMEYFFSHRDPATGAESRTAVYDFMVLPQQGVRADMESVVASAEDYQQRYYGAAQFQLVFGGALADNTAVARTARDDVFDELMTGPCLGVVETLCDGSLRP